MSLAPGESTRDVPLLRITDPNMRAALDAFAWKVTCALYYEKIGRILESKIGFEARWLSAAFPNQELLLNDVLQNLRLPPAPSRSGKSLSPYFDYAFNHEVAGRWAVFAVKLGNGLSLVAFVDPEGLLSQAASDASTFTHK
jgi:hypothetical protein